MSETTLFKERVKAVARGLATDESDFDGDIRACSFGRISARPKQSVVFRTRDGMGRAFAYSHLYSVSDDNPNLGFVIEFTRHVVVARGRNLLKAYHYLCDHKLVELAVIDELHALQFDPTDGIVTAIEIREGREFG